MLQSLSMSFLQKSLELLKIGASILKTDNKRENKVCLCNLCMVIKRLLNL